MPQPKVHHAQHDKQLLNLLALSKDGARAALEIDTHQDPHFVASEVLSRVVRGKEGPDWLRELAATRLHRRIIKGVEGLTRKKAAWHRLLGRSDVLEDTVGAVWERLLSDPAKVANSEVYFGPFVQSSAIDYLRGLFALKRSTPSYEDLKPPASDSDQAESFIDRIAGADEDGPEATAIRDALHGKINAAYLALPKSERLAVYFRLEQGYSWAEVTVFMSCSEPTARKYYKNGLKTLLGAMS